MEFLAIQEPLYFSFTVLFRYTLYMELYLKEKRILGNRESERERERGGDREGGMERERERGRYSRDRGGEIAPI